MPLVKTIKEGNTTTEVHDLMGGVGKLSADEVLQGTGGKAGQFTEIQPDGSKITYFVEEVSMINDIECHDINATLEVFSHLNTIHSRKKNQIMK